jgi:hypothetical protein
MELLKYGIPHRVAHDLESIVYVLLFICTHLQGPCNAIGDPPLYGGAGSSVHKSGIQQWINTKDPKTLGQTKFTHMIALFEEDILPFISPYFKPIIPFISELWNILFPQRLTKPTVGKESMRSSATCLNVINAFKSVLQDKALQEEAKNPSTILGKRSRPGELISNGWDAVEPTKKLLSGEAKDNQSTPRKSKLMRKSRRL